MRLLGYINNKPVTTHCNMNVKFMWLMLGWSDTTHDNVSVMQLYWRAPVVVKDGSKPGNALVSSTLKRVRVTTSVVEK
jgi:hypothetical protein